MRETTLPSKEHASEPEHGKSSGLVERRVVSGRSAAWLASGLGPRIMFSPDDGAGSGDAGNAGAGAAAGDAGAAGAAAGSEAAARPDWLGEQFWDDGTKTIKGADLKTHLDELAAFKAAQDSKAAAVPEKPDGYELKLPADLKFGEGEGFELKADDPMVQFGRDVAHQMGLDQTGFEKLVGMYAQREVANAKELQAAIGKQMEALGPKGSERQAAAKTFLTAKLGPDAAAVFEGVLMVKTGVEHVERLMRLVSGGGGPAFSGTGRETGKAAPTEEEYAAMSPADRLVAARKAASGGR